MKTTYPHALSISRRRLFRWSLGFAAGAALSPGLHAASQQMLRKEIPSSGESLPVIGLGTSRTFDAPPDTEGLLEVLRGFAELGGTLVDSSPMYGQAEKTVGVLAQRAGVSERLFYATKVWTSGREAGIRQMQASAERMGTERIDLMQIHNLVDWRTHLATLKAWKDQGRIRYIGITHYQNSALDALSDIIEQERIDFVQLAYNIANREAERRLLPLARERGVAVLVNRPFQRADLFRATRGKALPGWAAEIDCSSWAQVFLKFIVSHPAVTCVIPATSKPKHLKDNMQAGYGRMPNAALREKMAAAIDA